MSVDLRISPDQIIERYLSMELVRVTERAAVSAARLRGHGNEKAADQAAVDAMRRELNRLPIDGEIVIGEGERDEAPMLFIGEKVGSPAEIGGRQVIGREPVGAGLGEDGVDAALAGRVGCTAQRQRNRSETQFEQSVPTRGLQVIMPLRRRPADQFDLAIVETEARIGLPALGLDRTVVGKQDALRAALDDGRRDAAARDIGEALRGEQDRHVLLAEGLQPLADTRGEERMVEEDPGFVEDQQCRATVETFLEAVEQIRQHRGHDARLSEERLGLEALDVGERQPALTRIQKPSVRSVG